jgi:hypothetical protein
MLRKGKEHWKEGHGRQEGRKKRKGRLEDAKTFKELWTQKADWENKRSEKARRLEGRGKKATSSAFWRQVGKGKIEIDKIRGVRRQEDWKEEA